MKGKELELVYTAVAGLATYNQLRSVGAALFVSFLMIVVIVAFQLGWVERLLARVDWRGMATAVWRRLRPRPVQIATTPPNTIPLAQDKARQEWIFADIGKLQSTGIFAKRGQGKTALVDALLFEMIKRCQPHGRDGVQLAILDPKRVDYTLYARLPHLAIPLAQTKPDFTKALRWAVAEMERRARLFNSFTDRKCNDVERYHRLCDELGRSDLPELPHLFVLVEEAQEVTSSKADEEMLETLLKVGRAFGINVWPITQRNTADALSNDIQSQLSTRFFGYMAGASTDLKRIGMGDVPAEIIAKMDKRPGHFLLDYDGAWYQVYVPLVPDRELEAAVQAVSLAEPPTWPKAAAPAKQKLSGSKRQKETAVKQWFVTLDKKPTIQEFMEHFGCAKNTAVKWINEAWS